MRLTFEKGELKAVNDEKFDDLTLQLHPENTDALVFRIRSLMLQNNKVESALSTFQRTEPIRPVTSILTCETEPVRLAFFCEPKPTSIGYIFANGMAYTFSVSIFVPPSGASMCSVYHASG